MLRKQYYCFKQRILVPFASCKIRRGRERAPFRSTPISPSSNWSAHLVILCPLPSQPSTIKLATLNERIIWFETSCELIRRENRMFKIRPSEASRCLTFPLGIEQEYSFIMITVTLLGLSRFVAAFFFFCKGKTTDSAVGSKCRLWEWSRFCEVFVGKYEAKILASAWVGFVTLDMILSAFIPNDLSYKNTNYKM